MDEPDFTDDEASWPTDRDLVRPFANVILDESATLIDKLEAAVKFTGHVRDWEARHWADHESKMYQRKRWTDAFGDELKAGGRKQHKFTAKMTRKIGVELHFMPIKLGLDSIAEQVCCRFPSLPYEHLMTIASHSIIEADAPEDVQLNQKRCLMFAEQTINNEWTPKKLESEIKKQFGLRAGGRPRKAK